MNRSSALLPLTALLAAGTAAAQMVVTINSTTDTLAAFSPVDGSLITSSLFPLANTTMVSAIEVNDEIWISEQVTDRITRYDMTGTILGTIGPTLAGSGFDNIRGIGYVNGLVYVTNFQNANGATANSVVILDASGNHISTFPVAGLATNPFAVIGHQGDILVTGFSNTQDVYRFTALGVPISTFHDSTIVNPAHGLSPAIDGNVWCASFTDDWLVKLDATTGAILQQIVGGSTTRGVYQVANGNLLWTDGAGVHLYDMVSATSSLLLAGNSYHLNLVGGTLASAIAYGTGCDGLVLAANGLPQIGNANFALLLNNVPAVSPVGLFAFGSVAVNPGIDLTVIGMPGCFGYTNSDIGLFTGSLVASGTSTFPLGIPSTPSLSGASLASQGLSFSVATPLGLATSNGLSLVLGN
jgi:hypothetical protein